MFYRSLCLVSFLYLWVCIRCFDTVVWASGRASDPWNVEWWHAGLHGYPSVWSEVQMICIRSSWCGTEGEVRYLRLPCLCGVRLFVCKRFKRKSCCAGELERALCSRVVAAKGEVVEKGHTVEQAKYGRDALAKVCLCLSVCLSVCLLSHGPLPEQTLRSSFIGSICCEFVVLLKVLWCCWLGCRKGILPVKNSVVR